MRLEGVGSEGDIVEYVHVDENNGSFVHEMKQDVEPYLKRIRDLEHEQGNDVGKIRLAILPRRKRAAGGHPCLAEQARPQDERLQRPRYRRFSQRL